MPANFPTEMHAYWSILVTDQVSVDCIFPCIGPRRIQSIDIDCFQPIGNHPINRMQGQLSIVTVSLNVACMHTCIASGVY